MLSSYEKTLAKYRIIGNYYFDVQSSMFTNKHKFNTDDYNLHIHQMLGEYLRCLRGYYGLDLMSLYNCASPSFINNLSIDKIELIRNYILTCSTNIICTETLTVDNQYYISGYKSNTTLKNNYKHNFLVPVKFNTPYTLTLNDPANVYVCPLLIDIDDVDEESAIFKLNQELSQFNSALILNNPCYNYHYNIHINSESPNGENFEKYEKYLYLYIETATGE